MSARRKSASVFRARTPANMTTYLLAKHVFICICGSDVVFLDLKEDKYLSMDAAKVRNVLALPADSASPKVDVSPQPGGTHSLGSDAGQRSAQALLKRGLLTLDSSAGKPVELANPDDPEKDLIGIAPEVQPKLRLIDAVRFVSATLSAWKAMRFGSLEEIVSDVGTRRRLHSSGERAVDLDRARSCTALFERMRPYMFSARDKCLFDSFVLSNFLAKYGIYPQWVFGVTTSPFAAHCWLQHQRVVFNDYAEHAREFTPILTI
jgi:hypothetical protein